MPKQSIPRMYPNPTDFDLEDPQSGASLLDFFFAHAPPPPDDYQVDLDLPKEPYPSMSGMSPGVRSAWELYTELGVITKDMLAGLSKKEEAVIREAAAQYRRAVESERSNSARYEAERQARWRWMFARAALSSRKAAHQEV